MILDTIQSIPVAYHRQQAELFDGAATIPRRTSKKVATSSFRTLPAVAGGLFPLVESISRERFQAVFVSGASAYYDAKGLVDAEQDIGVVADRLTWRVQRLLRDYLEQGGQIFVDSGAYGAYKAWKDGKSDDPALDFDTVFAIYDDLAEGLSRPALQRLSLVMPDVLANPDRSLHLLAVHRDVVRRYIAAGINAIVPIQQGKVPAGHTVETVARILGTRHFTVGVPSSAASMDMSDIATIRGHQSFHILGRGTMGLPLFQRAYAFLEHNPGAAVSCDANQLRTHLGAISGRHAELRVEADGCAWDSGPYEETELLGEILDGIGWMTLPQVTRLAEAYGVTKRSEVRKWVDAHRGGTGLRHLVETIDPDCSLLWSYALRYAFGRDAEKHVSARLRAEAVTDVFRILASEEKT
jgi:hypothetical protein